jgi:hypothetical protein
MIKIGMKLIMHNMKSHLASCPTDLVWQVVLILTIVVCASKQAQGLKATIYRKEKALVLSPCGSF